MSDSRTARSFSESPAGAGAPLASAAATSGGTAAGKLRWMPSNPAGAGRAIALEMGAPQSPPWATQGVYPERFHPPAPDPPVWSVVQPVPGALPGDPYDGT